MRLRAVLLGLLARTTRAWPKIEECPHFPGSTPIAEYHACILDRMAALAAAAAAAPSAPRRAPAMVQVGAHLAWLDVNDPFRRATEAANGSALARTVLVEPQPHIAARLARAVARDARGGGGGGGGGGEARAVDVLRAAVCAADGANVTFYGISPEVDATNGHLRNGRGKLQPYTSQVASLSREHLLRHKRRIPQIEQYIVEERVPCYTVASVLERYGIRAADAMVLTVDAEGEDAAIIESVDFGADFAPWLVVFEYFHLMETNFTRLTAAQNRLLARGYSCWRDEENFWFLGGRGGWGTSPTREEMAACGARRGRRR